jgi:hypothetical protein
MKYPSRLAVLVALCSVVILAATSTAIAGTELRLKSGVKVATTTSLEVSNEALRYGDEQIETFSVSVSSLGAGTPTGKVTVEAGKTKLCTITLSAGGGTCSPKASALKEGSYSVLAAYAGSSSFEKSESASQTLIVNSTGVAQRINLCGTLTRNETLAPNTATVYVVTCNVVIPSGVSVTAQPGTIVKTEGGVGIEVNGSLTAAGTSSSPVTFTSIKDNSVGGETDGEESTPSAGEWRGITASVGSGAKTGPSVSLEHATVSYAEYFDTSEAASVSLTNSRFVRGGGTTCCGYDGVSVSGSGPINVSNDTFVGLAHSVSGYYSAGLSVSQNGSGGSATTTVSGNTLENMDSTAVTVTSKGPITVQNNKVVGGTGDAFQLSSGALNPASITGNTSSGDKQNALSVEGTLSASWALPYSGLPVVVNSRLTVPEGITLSLAAGTVLKFEDDGLLEVNGSLTAAGTSSSPVTFTSIKDNSVGGETDGEESTPSAGEWRGITASVGSGAKTGPSVSLEHATVSYAEYFDTSEAASVSLTNSRFVRGGGTTCCGYDGVSVSGSGPINVSNDTFVGLAHSVSGYYSAGLSVSQNGSGGSATTTVSGNTLENMDSTAVTVTSKGPITVQNNKVVGGTGDAFQLSSGALNPASITGNTSSGDKQNALSVEGTLSASWALPYSGLPVVVNSRLTVPEGITLSLAAGTVLKFEDDGLLEVNGSLTAAGTSSSPVTFTSIKDNSVGGETDGEESTPSAGEWRGITASVGSGAKTGPSVSLEHATVSYAEYFDTSEAASVSLTNSRFVRGGGTTCCGYDGVSVSGSGPINVSNDTFVGLAHSVSGYYSAGLSVSQNGSGGSATTTVSGNTLENMDSTAVTVTSKGPITVQNNKVVGGTGDAFQLSSGALNPASITGNTSSGDKQNALSVEGTLSASWALPYSGLPVVVNSRLTVPEGITLSLAAGTVLKFEDDGLLEVNGSLTAAGTSSSPVTFTSIKDNSVGGETDGEESTPSAGEWRGITASVGSGAKTGPSVSLEHATVSYAEYFDTSEAASVSLTNSRFVRGGGTTCCGYDGVSVSGSGPINVSNDTFVGLAHSVSGYYSAGLSVSQNGSGGSATTTVSGNTLENMDSTAVTVTSKGPITVQNNKVVGGTGDAFQLSSGALNPASITGNTSSGDKQNALSVEGTLSASWALPYSGLPVVVNSRLTVPEGITLSLAAGTVLKFEDRPTGCSKSTVR